MKSLTNKSKSTMSLKRTALWILALLTTGCLASAQMSNTFYEGFENIVQAQNDWVVSGGTWEIGTPTFGPPPDALGHRAFMGTNCAATVLAGNYTDNTSGRLESKLFVVPATNQNPHLRFWQWYSYGNGDFGQVQIKRGTGAWQTLATFSGYSGGTWTRPTIDLTAYAGQTVQIGFYFESHQISCCSPDVGPGWYVDEVAVVTGASQPLVPNVTESFEGTNFWDNWSNDNGTWQSGVPTSGPGAAHSGSNVIATVLGGNYGDNTSSRLVSPPLTVPSADQNPRLRFWQWYSYGNGDFGQVQIKLGTNAWISLAQFSGYSGGTWTRPTIDLTAYVGQTVQLGFYFESHQISCCSSDVGPGWYVDELVLVTGVPAFYNPVNCEEMNFWDNWSCDTGTWQQGKPTSGPGIAHEGSNVVASVLGGNYGDNTSSRLVSPPFVVPPKATGPRLRFWQWYSFGNGDFGQVQVKAGTNAWMSLAQVNGSSGGTWAQPSFDLSPYAGQTIQLGFYFESHQISCCSSDVGPGWYIDQLRLLHDFAALLLDSPVVRTQNTACISIGIADSSPASNVSFTVRAPSGNLAALVLNTLGCWSGTITAQPNSQWLVNLQNSCTNTPMGVITVGSICYTAVSTQSAFVPFSVNNLGVTNLDTSVPSPVYAFGTRSVNIANESLLEAWLAANKQRMFTLYGKANTNYVVNYTTNINTPSPWTPGWTNIMPAGLFYSQSVLGTLSNAPVLFLRANEK